MIGKYLYSALKIAFVFLGIGIFVMTHDGLCAVPLKIEQIFKDVQLQRILKKYILNEDFHPECIEQFQADNAKISDLSGFDKFNHLKYLSLSQNLIHNVHPLRTLTNLQVLNLGHNLIREAFPLTQLTRLESLDLSYNQMRHCFFCKFLSLQMLNVSHNAIQQLYGQDVNCNKFLLQIDLSDNPLRQFPENFYAPSIKEINCNQTHLNSVAPFFKLNSLEILRVKNCPNIRSLEGLFQKSLNGQWQCILPHLRTLEISENYLIEQDREVLSEIRKNGLPFRFCLNDQVIEPAKNANSSPIKF